MIAGGILTLMFSFLCVLVCTRQIPSWPLTFLPLCLLSLTALVYTSLVVTNATDCGGFDGWWPSWHAALSAFLFCVHGFLRSLHGAEARAGVLTRAGNLGGFLLLTEMPPETVL